MAVQTVFKRYELKYLLTAGQTEKVLRAMAEHMQPDAYGATTIRNLYYDTDTYLLIRRSMEKPAYKEKLRIRSYSRANADSPVFVELKKKYQSVVYKRRLCLANRDAAQWLEGQKPCGKKTQIAEEIDYVMKLYGSLHPVVFLSYERQAYYGREDADFRITFDDTILCRQEDLSLEAAVYGTPILPEGMTLMEIKCSGGIPLWMTRVLSEEKIYKTSFSKYATAYAKLIFPQTHDLNAYSMLEVSTNAG